DEYSINYHYCWIKDMSKLISSQKRAIKRHRIHLCDGCLQYFGTELLLQRHLEHDCEKVRIRLPSSEVKTDRNGMEYAENVLKFRSVGKQMRVPFVFYGDFETILAPISTCESDPSNSSTLNKSQLVPYSVGVYLKCSDDPTLNEFFL